MNSKNFVFNFGKYKGKTIEEVFNIDDEYLFWIEKNFKPGIVLSEVKKFLNEERNLPWNETENENEEDFQENEPQWNENDIPF